MSTWYFRHVYQMHAINNMISVLPQQLTYGIIYQVPRFVYVPIPYNYSIYLRYIWILGYTTSYVFSYCLTIFAKTCCLILWILLENHLYCVLTYVMYVLHPKIESIGQELWMNCQIRRIWVFEKAQCQNDFINSKNSN